MQTAELVATEFFQQGDKEREELKIEPSVSGRYLLHSDRLNSKNLNTVCCEPQGSCLGPRAFYVFNVL